MLFSSFCVDTYAAWHRALSPRKWPPCAGTSSVSCHRIKHHDHWQGLVNLIPGRNTVRVNIHKSGTRGKADLGWLNSRHTYSFSLYHDPDRMGFGKLRVINDDLVRPSMGFGTHPHNNMEIVSIPLKGSLRHKDSMGNTHIIRAGEVQIMSAGTGIQHSEYNNSDTDDVNFLQIWILPKLQDVSPRYEQKQFDPDARWNKLQLLVSPSGKNNSIQINQDVFMSLVNLEAHTLKYVPQDLANGVYVFVISGAISINGLKLGERDGAEVSEATTIIVLAEKTAELLFIETPIG